MRRSKRRIGRSCYAFEKLNQTDRREGRFRISARHIGRRSTHLFAAAAIRRLMRRISFKTFLFICFSKTL